MKRKKLLSSNDMRRFLTETELPSLISRSKAKVLATLPPKPKLPDGVPQDWEEALFTPGPCALPLWCGNGWMFGIFCDGEPIVDSRTQQIVKFHSYNEAITEVKGYFEWQKQNNA